MSAGADGLLKLWSVRSSECTTTLDAHEDKVWALAAGGGGAVLASGGGDGAVAVWEDCTQVRRGVGSGVGERARALGPCAYYTKHARQGTHQCPARLPPSPRHACTPQADQEDAAAASDIAALREQELQNALRVGGGRAGGWVAATARRCCCSAPASALAARPLAPPTPPPALPCPPPQHPTLVCSACAG